MMIDNKLYNPAGQPKEWLIEHFVVRTKVFEKIFKDIKQGAMKYPEQHYLIQGQRGMGKTTLLLRLKYEIENTPELNSWLVPVFFNEESYDLTSLSNLWEKLFKYLDDEWQTGSTYYKQTDAFVGLPNYEKLCFNLLLDILHTEKKKLVIFFDNFGQLFLEQLSEKEQHRFREILMHNADIRIIGASAVVLQDLHDYSMPFFEFFKIINLEGLNKDETVELIRKLEEKSEKPIDLEKNKAKIETLAILTSGVIRTVMLIYEVILADQDGSALRDLETILDRITPLYKHRIEDLPVQQRKIVDVIAKKWDAISTKEIAENIRENGQPMPTKLISAQLQQLERNNVIEKKQTNTKNHLYQLNERFFNIWYLMRNGDRNDKCKVIWLTKFLELWYEDEKALGEFVKHHISHLQSGKYHAYSAIMMAEALSRSSKLDLESQAILIQETANILKEDEVKYLPKIHFDILNELDFLYKNFKFQEVINKLERLDYRNDFLNELHVLSYINLNQPQEALRLLDIFDEKDHVKMYLRGEIYLIEKKYDDAIHTFSRVLEYELPKTFKKIYTTRLGYIYKFILNDSRKALKYYLITLEEGNEVYEEIANLFVELEEYENAEKYYQKGIDAGKTELKNGLIWHYIFNLKENSKATTLIEKALLSDQNNPYYYYCKGIIFYYDDKLADARREFHKTIALSSNHNDQIYVMTVLFLCHIYYYDEGNKKEALDLVNSIKDYTAIDLLIMSLILIWNEEYDDGFNLVRQYFEEVKSENFEVETENIQELLLLLLAKKQYHFTLKLFQNEKFNLKERMKPIYYALMHYMKDEYPNEYLRMGDELKQPVEDVMKKIEQMAVDYA